MGMTIVEKILNHAGGCKDRTAGDIVDAKISFLMTNDAVGELIRSTPPLGTKNALRWYWITIPPPPRRMRPEFTNC